MKRFTVEASYSTIRRVSVEIAAVDEIGAQSEFERLIAGEGDVASGWLAGAVGAEVRVLQNVGTMVPQLITVFEAPGI